VLGLLAPYHTASSLYLYKIFFSPLPPKKIVCSSTVNLWIYSPLINFRIKLSFITSKQRKLSFKNRSDSKTLKGYELFEFTAGLPTNFFLPPAPALRAAAPRELLPLPHLLPPGTQQRGGRSRLFPRISVTWAVQAGFGRFDSA
jgi:hypothetical protein